MSDLIDRQAAIDAFLTELTKRERTSLLHTWSTVEVKYFIAKILEQLPSAQPGCEDAVSRFEVLRLIDYSSHDLNDSVDNRYMQNEIKQLPSVTPKQPGWIPCSERLPDNDIDVLVTDGTDCAVAYWRTDAQAWDDSMHGWCDLYGLEVTAWMPLPTPYREGGQS